MNIFKKVSQLFLHFLQRKDTTVDQDTDPDFDHSSSVPSKKNEISHRIDMMLILKFWLM